MKQGLAKILKIVAGMAALACLLAPLTDMGMLVFAVAFVVAISTGVASSHLGDDEDHSGYWPKDPNSPTSR
jgi:hypothetical protein